MMLFFPTVSLWFAMFFCNKIAIMDFSWQPVECQEKMCRNKNLRKKITCQVGGCACRGPQSVVVKHSFWDKWGVFGAFENTVDN